MNLKDQLHKYRAPLNLIIPFTVGALLANTYTLDNWRLWVIGILLLIYRGTRVEKIDG